MIKTYDILKKYDFSIQKKYGQNFLTDQNILEGIADAAKITKDDIVLEIGPGLGALTQYLCERAAHVIAVEIDRMLIPILNETLAGYDNLTLINGDILKTDIDELIRKTICVPQYLDSEEASYKQNDFATDPEDASHKNNDSGTGSDVYLLKQNIAGCNSGSYSKSHDELPKIKVVANLPYYITTPIIMELLEKEKNIRSITVMVQKEVAERMQEGPGTKSYGALSLAVQYYSSPRIAMTVSKRCFVPQPDVDSAVIHLEIYDPELRPVKAKDADMMFKIIRAAFNQRRKTLINSLSNSPAVPFSKEQLTEALTKMDKPLTIRGEALTLEEFALLSDLLSN